MSPTTLHLMLAITLFIGVFAVSSATFYLFFANMVALNDCQNNPNDGEYAFAYYPPIC